jgi:hypothetical protein
MGFWVRNIIFGCILVSLAIYFLLNQDLMMSFTDAPAKSPSTTEAVKTDDVVAPTPAPTPKPTKKTTTNKAAKGLSAFYANINAENIGKNGPVVRNNIVYLPDHEDDLELLLDARRKIVRAYPKNWQGEVESRPFRLGETIFQKLYEYAEEERLAVFWRINRDFVVKDAFRINKTVLKTALQLAQGIEGHFQNGLSVYFCYQSKSIVMIEGTKSYLDERCKLIKPKLNY